MNNPAHKEENDRPLTAGGFDDDCPATLYCTVLSAPLRREFASLAAPLSRDGLFV
jgi:hypothetical protein